MIRFFNRKTTLSFFSLSFWEGNIVYWPSTKLAASTLIYSLAQAALRYFKILCHKLYLYLCRYSYRYRYLCWYLQHQLRIVSGAQVEEILSFHSWCRSPWRRWPWHGGEGAWKRVLSTLLCAAYLFIHAVNRGEHISGSWQHLYCGSWLRLL